MPAWTLADLMSNATTALGQRADLTASTVSFWVNQAYEDVWYMLPHNQQEAIAVSSTTVNEDKLALPSDFAEILVLSNLSDSNSLLDAINLDQLAHWDSSSSGRPTHYAEYNTWLELRPIPDSAYSLELRYLVLRSELTATTSVPSIATRLRPAIMYRAVELLANNVTLSDERAAFGRSMFQTALGIVPSDRALRSRNQHTLSMSLARTRGRKGKSQLETDFDKSD